MPWWVDASFVFRKAVTKPVPMPPAAPVMIIVGLGDAAIVSKIRSFGTWNGKGELFGMRFMIVEVWVVMREVRFMTKTRFVMF